MTEDLTLGGAKVSFYNFDFDYTNMIDAINAFNKFYPNESIGQKVVITSDTQWFIDRTGNLADRFRVFALLAFLIVSPSSGVAQLVDQDFVDVSITACLSGDEALGDPGFFHCPYLVHQKCLDEFGHDTFAARACWDAEYDGWNRSLMERITLLKSLSNSSAAFLDEGLARFQGEYRNYCGLEASMLGEKKLAWTRRTAVQLSLLAKELARCNR